MGVGTVIRHVRDAGIEGEYEYSYGSPDSEDLENPKAVAELLGPHLLGSHLLITEVLNHATVAVTVPLVRTS